MGKSWGTVKLNDTVLKELKIREAALATKQRSPELLTYLNANVPWVRLQSGVNKGSKTNSDLAKSYVLTGGRTEGRKGINLSSGPQAYYDGSFGVRPMPGITGISVRCRDTWGCVLECKVNIRCYSLEDLEAMDDIYFRPGFSAVLEWGWTLRWNGSRVETEIKQMPGDYFGPELFAEIQQKVEASRSPNHAACMGYITNFSWSFNKGGGYYDCTVTLLSAGSVLEGMKIAAAHDSGKDGFSYKKTSDSPNRESIISWCSPIYTAIQEGKNPTGQYSLYNMIVNGNVTCTPEVSFDPGTGNKVLVNLKNVKAYNYVVTIEKSLWLFGSDHKEHLTYLRLEDVLRLINAYNVKGEGSNYIFATSDDLDEEGVAIYDNNYVSCSALFSLDPYKCVVPGRQKEVSYKIITGETDDGIINYTSDNGTLAGEVGLALPGTVGRIFDLYISINYLNSMIQSEIDTNSDSFLAINYIRAVLDGINKSLGNIVSFDIGIDDARQRYFIVDRNYFEKCELPKLVSCGIGTVFTDIKATSEVSSDLANMMSVAAQGGKDVSPALTSWNDGLYERHVKSSDETKNTGGTHNAIESAVKEADLKQFWIDAKNIYRALFCGEEAADKHEGADSGEISLYAYQKLQLIGEKLFNECVQAETNGGKGMPVGVFPVKFCFTTKGIDGFVIGERFGLEEGVLPRKYKDWAFIITGVEHTVDEKGWYTSVKTQYFPNNLSANPSQESVEVKEGQAPSAREEEKDIMDDESGTWNIRVYTNWNVTQKEYSKDPVDFMREQGYTVKTGHDVGDKHLCTRGSIWYARFCSKPESSWESILPKTNIGTAGVTNLAGVGVDDPKDPRLSEVLGGYGYSLSFSKDNLTPGEIKALDHEPVVKPGDVVAYWSTKHGKMHTCVKRVNTVRTKNSRQSYVSDFLQNNMYVYGSYGFVN